MTFILRSVGIPARIVGGYLGGTYVEAGGYIQVRQMEAHAWVEAWLEGRWQRIDPTAAVAPNRIELNVDDLLSESQPSDLPLISRVQGIGFINQLTMWWDLANYQWQVLVLDYDNERALSWFSFWFWQCHSDENGYLCVFRNGLCGFDYGFRTRDDYAAETAQRAVPNTPPFAAMVRPKRGQ